MFSTATPIERCGDRETGGLRVGNQGCMTVIADEFKKTPRGVKEGSRGLRLYSADTPGPKHRAIRTPEAGQSRRQILSQPPRVRDVCVCLTGGISSLSPRLPSMTAAAVVRIGLQ